VGTSLVAIRLRPALCGALSTYLSVAICRRLGGDRYAQLVTGLATIVCGYLAIHHYYSMNSLDLLFWVLAFYLLMNVLEEPTDRRWAWLGIVLGLGLLNKVSVLWLGAGLAVGLLATGHRRHLLTRGPWIAGVVSAVVFWPYVLWQIVHGWPTLEFVANASSDKMVTVSLLEFFSGQMLYMNPFHAPIWIVGLLTLLLTGQFREWRIFGWIYLTVAAILVLNGQSKSFYLGPAYPPLLAAGAMTLESLFKRPGLGWGRPALLAFMALGALVLIPMALPILSPETHVRYTEILGFKPPAEERHEETELPQQYADMFGWREQAEAVVRAWSRLTPEERERAGIFGGNYGRAGAVDLFARGHGLPPAISGHNSYWFWGPGDPSPEILIIVGGSGERARELFEDVVEVEVVRSRWAMPYESDLPIYIARMPRQPLEEVWPSLRNFN
jgi:hypothetical protein